MKYTIQLVATGTLGLLACGLWALRPEPVAASPIRTASTALAPDQVDLRGHFVEGRSKLYEVTETITTIHEPRRSHSNNEIFDSYVRGLAVEPLKVVETRFVEEERCEELLADGAARLSYGVRSYGWSETVDGEVVASLEVRSLRDLARLPQDPRAKLIGSLMEAPVRFDLGRDFDVSNVDLPGGSATQAYADEYAKNLEARYRGFFPGRPVRPGDRWTSEVPFSESIVGDLWGGEDRVAILRGTFVGLESYEGVECARVHIELDFGVQPGHRLERTTISQVVLDELSAETSVLYDVAQGVIRLDETRMTFAAHRTIGLEETEKMIVPYRVVKDVRSTFVGFEG